MSSSGCHAGINRATSVSPLQCAWLHSCPSVARGPLDQATARSVSQLSCVGADKSPTTCALTATSWGVHRENQIT